MDGAGDGERVAASLADWLATVTFVDLDVDAVTTLLVDSVVAWATANGWRSYRRAASVLPLPAPYAHQHSILDVGCARPDGAPIVIEVDHTDRRRSVEKLLAEAEAGRVAIWLRWGNRRFEAPPLPVRMVTCPVTSRPGPPGQGRLHSHRLESDRPAPRHTGLAGPAEQQPDLFTGPSQ
jgi:hypothetical protein